MRQMRKFAKDKGGWTAVEYGLIAGILGLFLIVLFGIFGSDYDSMFIYIGQGI